MEENLLNYTFHNDFKEVSIRDLLNTKPMVSCDMIITEEGLEHIIKSATVMDVEDIENWLHEGDILIVSRFMRTCLTESFINTLHRKKISGVITHKLYEKYITEEQKELLIKYHIPLIFIEDHVPWSSMIVLIQNLIINNQTQYLVENQNFQNSIINYLSNNYLLNSLCEIVHNLTKITIALADYNLRIQDSSNDNDWNSELRNLRVSTLLQRIPVGENFNGTAMNGYKYHDNSVNEQDQYFIIPSHISKFTSAFYIIVKYRSSAETLPPELICRLETIMSIYSLKISITAEFEKSNYYFKSVVFESLLDLPHEDHARKKQISLSLNTELSNSYYLLLINSRKDLNLFNNVELLTGFINHLKHIRLYNNKFLVFLYKEQWVILIDDKVRSIKDVGMQLYDALSTYFNSSHFIMGISDLHRYYDLRRAYNEAVFTLNYVRNRQDSVSLLIYGELGIIKLFTDSNGNINDAYLDELYQLYLRPILEYDRKHSSDLYFTLESFFSNELSYKLTSEKLFIHVNTLHARISKIEHLIHVSFSNLDSIIGLRLTILLNQFDYFSHYRSHPA